MVNADTGALEGKISGLKLSHGVAVVPASGRGFVSDGAQGKAIIFDLKTLKVAARQMPRQTRIALFTTRLPNASSLSMVTAIVPQPSTRKQERI